MEYLIFTHFQLSANGHLFLSLMGTIRNGSTLIVVLNTADGSYVIVFTHFILFLFVYQKLCLSLQRNCKKTKYEYNTFT